MSEHGDDPDWAPPGGESFNAVVGRVRRWKAELEAGDPDATVLAVSHGIFLRFFLMDSLLEERFAARDVHRLWQLRTGQLRPLRLRARRAPSPGGPRARGLGMRAVDDDARGAHRWE